MAARGRQYDHPDFHIRREFLLVNQSAASATDFAFFRTRQKTYVYAVHIIVKSASSADERFYVIKKSATTTLATTNTLTPATGGSVGGATTAPSSYTITITTLNTLVSMGDVFSLRHDNTGGIYDVIWEYAVLTDSDET